MEKVPERIGYLPLDTRNSLNPAQQDQRHQRGERDFFDVPRQVAQPGFLNPTLKIRLQDVMHIIIARAVIPRYLCTRYIRSEAAENGLKNAETRCEDKALAHCGQRNRCGGDADRVRRSVILDEIQWQQKCCDAKTDAHRQPEQLQHSIGGYLSDQPGFQNVIRRST